MAVMITIPNKNKYRLLCINYFIYNCLFLCLLLYIIQITMYAIMISQ